MRIKPTTYVPIQLVTAVLGTLVFGSNIAGGPTTAPAPPRLTATEPEEVLRLLDLSRPGLSDVRAAISRGDENIAWEALLKYYRSRFPRPGTWPSDYVERADQIVKHIFDFGHFGSHDYGPDVDWPLDPVGDNEWVCLMYRFGWVEPLVYAYRSTRDDKYAQAFVDLTTDWIHKHPLNDWQRSHPVYTKWRGFAWLDIQTGYRIRWMGFGFQNLLHSSAFTTDFLKTFLASVNDHQVKSTLIPRPRTDNKLYAELRGLIETAIRFPEFKEASGWTKAGLNQAQEALLQQTTPDGVHREWSGDYHLIVMESAIEFLQIAEQVGIPPPSEYVDRIQAMCDYTFAMATPELDWPMFGDTRRVSNRADRPLRWRLYRPLLAAANLFYTPKYAARAKLATHRLPKQTSYAFTYAGMYVMRSEWGMDQIYMALHCSPPPLSAHDQPDNGTFELYAFGRWLMTDSGFYTYGGDREAKQWHRQTRVHQTLTLDNRDTRIDGRHRLWHAASDGEVLVVENKSYPNLIHRRTVWFVDHRFFVILDEAIGNVHGTCRLHFQFAPGQVIIDESSGLARTNYANANLFIWPDPRTNVTITIEQGWQAHTYGVREKRTAIAYTAPRPPPVAFLTLLVPYRDQNSPTVATAWPQSFSVGDNEVSIQVRGFDRTWQIGRNLARSAGWCRQERATVQESTENADRIGESPR